MVGRNSSIFNSSNIQECEEIEEAPMLTAAIFHQLEDSASYEDDFNSEIAAAKEKVEFSELQSDALEYLAGYIIKKLRHSIELNEAVCNDDKSWTYVDEVSEGGLIKPSQKFVETVSQLEAIFLNEKNNLSSNRNIFKSLLNLSSQINISEQVKKLFFKCRIYFFIKEKNKNIVNTKKSQNKKINKFIK